MSQFLQEEKVLTGAIKIERWFNRYKNILIIVAVFLVCAFLGYQTSLWYQEKQVIKNYALYEALLKDKNNGQKKAELKATGSPLYDLFLLNEAIEHSDKQALEQLEKSQDGFIGIVARYQNASLENTQTALDALLKQDEYAEPFKDILLFQKVYLLLKNNQFNEAHSLLSNIPIDSSVKSIAKFFEHYGITQVSFTQDQNHTQIDGVEILQSSDDAGMETGIENVELFQDNIRNP